MAELECFLRSVVVLSVQMRSMLYSIQFLDWHEDQLDIHAYTLEVSTMYSSYLEFENDFNQILAAAHHDDADLTWRMDAV